MIWLIDFTVQMVLAGVVTAMIIKEQSASVAMISEESAKSVIIN
jgi:hypothetical protein